MRGSFAATSVAAAALAAALVSCARQTCPIDTMTGTGGTLAVPRGEGEGMWPLGLLPLLDEERLRAKGLQMPIERLWAPAGEKGAGGGLARAAVKIVNGCSASFISPDGLIATNHHCAYGAISRNSTEEHNYLADGFLARTRAEELPGQGLTSIQVLQTFADVTDRVLLGLPEDPAERAGALDARESEIVAECERPPHTKCYVGRFLDGIPYEGEPDGRPRFTLFTTLEIRDVRVVAAPPEAVGNYGGEVDNWHWPRHSGDFSILRAYVAPDGTPSDYSEANVPYHPQVHLEVSTEGLGPGDFVTVMGYPWLTTRHLAAIEVEQQQDWYYPRRVELFAEWSRILHEQAQRSEQVAILVSSQTRGIDNGLSNARGAVDAFRQLDVLGERRRQEEQLRAWIAETPERQEQFGDVLDGVEAVVRDRIATRERDLLLRYLVYGSQLLGFARDITRWAAERQRPDLQREPGYQDRDEADLRSDLEHAQQSLDLDADRAIFLMLLGRAMALAEAQRIPALDEAVGPDRSPEALQAFAERLYAGSQLGVQERRLALFGQPLEALQASDDAMVRLALALAPLLDRREDDEDRRVQQLAVLRPRLELAISQWSSARLYPDATSTLRLSFGNVRGYSPRDGTLFTPFTTVGGLVVKNTGEEPFDAPQGLLDAAARSPSSRWADRPLGDVPACFLSDVDTTGGNSGSPIVDGQGRLVGLLFDGVWEDLAGDVAYSPRFSRSISVDIRYVLWILDDVMGADALLAELGIGAEEAR
jgi:hypothetical protein